MSPPTPHLEPLETRTLFAAATAAPWGFWPTATGLAKVADQYPWLTGKDFNVAVIDKGINYWHPALGGNRAANLKSPRIVNVYDYQDDDTDPFPSTSEKVDPVSPHATGVAGILAGVPLTAPDGKHYQGVLQAAQLYNFRTSTTDSQGSIKTALAWVAANAARCHIVAVNLTDFVGTGAALPVYDAELRSLANAGVFVATPAPNDWINPAAPRHPIGYPAKHPNIYGVGGIRQDGTITPFTQRGPGLDILAPAQSVALPYYVPSTNSNIWVNSVGAGNSWAAPYVTGAAALLKQIDPTLKPAETLALLKDGGTFTPDPDAAYTGIKGYQSLNIFRSVQLAYHRRDDAADQVPGSNDDRAHATRLTLKKSPRRVARANLKLLAHDVDLYQVDLPAAGPYEFAVGYDGPSSHPTAKLLNARGVSLATLGPDTTIDLPAGRHYLYLYNPTESLVGTYSLTVTRKPTPTTPPQPAPTLSAPRTRRPSQSLFSPTDTLLA